MPEQKDGVTTSSKRCRCWTFLRTQQLPPVAASADPQGSLGAGGATQISLQGRTQGSPEQPPAAPSPSPASVQTPQASTEHRVAEGPARACPAPDPPEASSAPGVPMGWSNCAIPMGSNALSVQSCFPLRLPCPQSPHPNKLLAPLILPSHLLPRELTSPSAPKATERRLSMPQSED